jgi:hypothetical protein
VGTRTTPGRVLLSLLKSPVFFPIAILVVQNLSMLFAVWLKHGQRSYPTPMLAPMYVVADWEEIASAKRGAVQSDTDQDGNSLLSQIKEIRACITDPGF